jgi:hypothetical protein
MTTAILIISSVFLISFVLLVVALWRAPEGYENEKGFFLLNATVRPRSPVNSANSFPSPEHPFPRPPHAGDRESQPGGVEAKDVMSQK